MDQSIESFSSIASSPPISPEPINTNPMDELMMVRQGSLTEPLNNEPSDIIPITQTEQFSPLDFQQTLNTSSEEQIPEAPEQTQEEPITFEAEQVLENVNEETVNDVPVLDNEHAPSAVVEPPIDFNDPIVQAQLKEEQRYESSRSEDLAPGTFFCFVYVLLL